MTKLSLHPLTGTCGAEISGLNLANVTEAEFVFVHTALLDHGV